MKTGRHVQTVTVVVGAGVHRQASTRFLLEDSRQREPCTESSVIIDASPQPPAMSGACHERWLHLAQMTIQDSQAEGRRLMRNYICRCGSGKDSYWVNDARGIPLGRMCEDCEQERLSKFRPDVLTDSNYWADEDIDDT